MKGSVSVILPTFNGEKYIGKALESALSQTLAPHEIIVVDDGSTDGTEKIVRSYGDKVRYIRQKNKGTAGAYNTGIRAASGDYVAFLEHDDVWAPEKNAIQVQRFLDEDENLGMVFSPVLLMEEDIPSKRHDIDVQYGEGEYSFADFFARNRVLNCSTVMIRRAVLEDIGFFRRDLRLAFDYDLWLRIVAKYRVVSLGAALVTYRIHSSNLSRDDHELMAAEGNLKTMLAWADDPFARKQVGKSRVKEKIAGLYRRMSWDYAKLDQRDEELRYLWEAVKVHPLRWGGWREYFWRRLDRRTRNRLTWYAGHLKRIFG